MKEEEFTSTATIIDRRLVEHQELILIATDVTRSFIGEARSADYLRVCTCWT